MMGKGSRIASHILYDGARDNPYRAHDPRTPTRYSQAFALALQSNPQSRSQTRTPLKSLACSRRVAKKSFNASSSYIESKAFDHECESPDQILDLGMVIAEALFVLLLFEMFLACFAFFFSHGH